MIYPIVDIVEPYPLEFLGKHPKEIVVYKDETRPIKENVIIINNFGESVWLAFLIPFLYNIKQFSMIMATFSSPEINWFWIVFIQETKLWQMAE